MAIAADLLRLLSPSTGAHASPSRNVLQSLNNGESFQSMLEKARGGQFSSGIGVTTARGAAVTLSPEQASRLAAAADVAEAHGAGRAVFLIDGQALRMDVGTRTVLGAVDASTTGVLTDIDTIVNVAPAGAAFGASTVAPPAALLPNNSLLRALARTA